MSQYSSPKAKKVKTVKRDDDLATRHITASRLAIKHVLSKTVATELRTIAKLNTQDRVMIRSMMGQVHGWMADQTTIFLNSYLDTYTNTDHTSTFAGSTMQMTRSNDQSFLSTINQQTKSNLMFGSPS